MGRRALRQKWSGDSNLIDVSNFVSHYHAFWSDHTPTSEHFVRRLNLQHTERWVAPIPVSTGRSRAAFVAELAFAQFVAKATEPHKLPREAALLETIRRLVPLIEDRRTLEAPFSEEEESDIEQIVRNLTKFFFYHSVKDTIILRPRFVGCGYIDTFEGDIINGETLFEIRTVDRPFRSADVRQLVTYCALNHLSGQYRIKKMGVCNPRRGLYFEMNLDEVCYEISGQTSQELFDALVHPISSGDISR